MTPSRLIVLGAALTLFGILMAAAVPIVGTAPADRIASRQTTGGVAVVVGWAVLAWGIHRLGREG